jgi:hypothetical protein
MNVAKSPPQGTTTENYRLPAFGCLRPATRFAFGVSFLERGAGSVKRSAGRR